MRTRSLLLPLLLLALTASAQDPQFSQWYAAAQYLNPALTGNTHQDRIALNYRLQWPGVQPGYETYMAAYDHRFSTAPVGMGAMVLRDKAGSSGLTSTTIGMSYSYEARINYKRAIRGGVRLGYTMRGVNPDGYLFADQVIRDNAPQTIEPVTFTATSTDADGTITLNEWDLDNDGTFEATGATASRSFRAAGRYTVRLRSSDQYGASSVAQRTIDVGNRPPIAAFAVSTASPLVGTPVTFIATSSDADGPRPAAAWDLGGGSAFADGASDSVTKTFDRPGSYTVRLRATDADGATDIVSRTITVAAAPAAKASLLSPAPIGSSCTLYRHNRLHGTADCLACTGTR